MESRKLNSIISLDKSRIPLIHVDNGAMSRKTLNLLLKELKSNNSHFILFQLALLTGIKPQEIVELKKKHLDEKTNSIYICCLGQKSQKVERWIGLDPAFFLELVRFAQNLKPEDYLFSGRDGSYSWRSISYTLAKIKKVTNQKIGFKEFQDSFCLELMKRGANLNEIAYFLGYKSNNSIRRKFRRMSIVQKDKIDILNSIFLKTA